MASYVAMDPELARRKTDVEDSADAHDYTDEEQQEKDEVEEIMEARKRYGQDRQSKEREWTESFKMYMSWLDTTLNPFLSNLFIPKTHEAVELLASFLIGNNQSITASPENGSSTPEKARVASRWLDWMWRKQLGARIRILIWIKQGIVFGNGIMKTGYDSDAKKPWIEVRPIEAVFFDYWLSDLQDSEYIIDEIPRNKEEVMADEKYDLKDSDGNLIRELVIEGGTSGPGFNTEALFNTYDGSLKSPECNGKVLCLEVWCTKDNRLKTLVPTSLGWRKARDVENPHYYMRSNEKVPFAPYVKLRFKPSPIPNRAYDMGAIYPTVKIQRAFNDLINEYFDSVVLINAPMWVKRRGARINPAELVRRPGGVITVSDIARDLRQEQVGDVKQSIIEMLNRLDQEFQKASMIATLLQQFSNTATGDSLEQVPLQAMRDVLDQNIVDALSELGQMVFAIAKENTEELQTIVYFETESEIGMLDFKPKDIDGDIDLIIQPDRDTHVPQAFQQKAMLDFITILHGDPIINAKYPTLLEKVYRRWLEDRGISDVEDFFDMSKAAPGAPAAPNAPAPRPPQMNLPEGITQIMPGEPGRTVVPGPMSPPAASGASAVVPSHP